MTIVTDGSFDLLGRNQIAHLIITRAGVPLEVGRDDGAVRSGFGVRGFPLRVFGDPGEVGDDEGVPWGCAQDGSPGTWTAWVR